MGERMPTEPIHPSEFIVEEITARGWSLDDLALAMGGDFGTNRLALDLYLEIGSDTPNMRLGGSAEQLATAFDVSAEYFLSLERAWLAARPDEKGE